MSNDTDTLQSFKTKTYSLSGDIDENNRGLNPTKVDLRNLLGSLNKKQVGTKNDQRYLKDLCCDLTKQGHFVYYQPYQSEDVSFYGQKFNNLNWHGRWAYL